MAVPGTLRPWISDITVLTASPLGRRPPLVHVPDAATTLVVRAAPGQSSTSRWAHLAVTAGYYDQSHMTAEFRTMMGVPPAAFFAGHLPQLQSC
jgi:AraC-like DNA-binding protein